MIDEEDPGRESELDDDARSALGQVTAVVLTHMRPGLAGDVTRSLIDVEGLSPDRIVVVVNGVGGLDDPALEAKVQDGPAGGQHADRPAASAPAWSRRSRIRRPAGPISARTTSACSTCPDRDSATWWDGPSTSTTEEFRPGRLVAYGRTFVGRGTHTVNLVPPPGSDTGFTPVDVACWGATLVSRSVVDAGVLPDPEWFFGLEDFDFFCRVREAGFEVLVDDDAARQVAGQQTSSGREGALRHRRPIDDDEAWRSYYHARNSFALIRRHGRPGWYGWQLAFTARQLQTARSRAERAAIVHGFWDGALGRMGENPRYGRRVGEFGPGPDPAEPVR